MKRKNIICEKNLSMENLLSMKCLNEMSLSMKYLSYKMYQRYFFSCMLKIHNTKN